MFDEDGNQYRPWVDLMRLERVEETGAGGAGGGDAFRSTCPAFGFGDRAYGGHFMAQALWAAAHTVRRGFCVHSYTGYFLVQGRRDIPFVYRVRTLRDGNGYCMRHVDVYQHVPEQLIFSCLCSFKRAEEKGLDVQEKYQLREKYALALRGKRPEEWPEAPAIDSPWWWERMKEPGFSREGLSNEPFPGVTRRKVDMTPYNDTVEPKDRVQLQYYAIEGSMPPVSEEPNLHAAAHIYCSDSNGLFIFPNALQPDDANNVHQIGSLSHAVVFHGSSEDLSWYDERGKLRWFCQESTIERFGYGRGLTPSRYWRDDGLHIMSTFQDGLLRLGSGMDDEELGAEDGDVGSAELPSPLEGSRKVPGESKL